MLGQEGDTARTLKAKRFNKFESSSRERTAYNGPLQLESARTERQGLKRCRTTEESDDNGNAAFKKKKVETLRESSYNTPRNTPLQSTKNLANSRMKILRERVQSSTPSNPQPSPADSKIEIPITHSLLSSPESNSPSAFLTMPKNNEITPPKNIANERLQNIRKSINPTDDELKKTPEQIKLEKKSQEKPSPNNRLQKIMACLAQENSKAKTTKDLQKTKLQDLSSTIISISDSSFITIDETFQDKTVVQRESDQSPASKRTNTLKRSTSCLSVNDDTAKKVAKHNSPLLTFDKANRLKKHMQRNSATPYKLPDRLKVGPSISDQCNKTDENPEVTKVPESLCLPSGDTFLDKMTRTSWWLASTLTKNVSSVFNSTFINNSADFSTNANAEDLDGTLKNNDLSDDDEEMEWTNAEPDETVIPSGSTLRPPETLDNIETEDITLTENSEQNKAGKIKDICLVVDTNVLVSHLSKIEELLDMKVESTFKLVVYVPWMVMNELDYIKDNYTDKVSLRNSAQKAIKFINGCLKQEHPRLKGQSIYDVEKQKLIGNSPDDKIIACSLQALEKYETVIVLSNDVNLRNKALINNLLVCSGDEVRMRVMMKLHSSIKSHRILKKMELFCSSMISHFAKVTFGDAWTKMDMLKGPPWPLSECLKRFKKYWFTLFSDKLLKHFQPNLDELQRMLNNDNSFCDNTPEYEKFKKKCIEICIHFRDIEEVRGLAQNAIDEIKKL